MIYFNEYRKILTNLNNYFNQGIFSESPEFLDELEEATQINDDFRNQLFEKLSARLTNDQYLTIMGSPQYIPMEREVQVRWQVNYAGSNQHIYNISNDPSYTHNTEELDNRLYGALNNRSEYYRNLGSGVTRSWFSEAWDGFKKVVVKPVFGFAGDMFYGSVKLVSNVIDVAGDLLPGDLKRFVKRIAKNIRPTGTFFAGVIRTFPDNCF